MLHIKEILDRINFFEVVFYNIDKHLLIDKDDLHYIYEYRLSYNKVYKRISIRINGKKDYLHRLILGVSSNIFDIDHINHDGMDNRKCNLRTCYPQQNYCNKPKINIKTSSKFKGVCWQKSANKWCSGIMVNYRKKHLGLFENELDAAIAYDKAAKEIHGEFASLNFN